MGEASLLESLCKIVRYVELQTGHRPWTIYIRFAKRPTHANITARIVYLPTGMSTDGMHEGQYITFSMAMSYF